MVFVILVFSFLVSRVRMCAYRLVCACACMRMHMRMRMRGGGRASIGVRACLRFGDVLKLTIGEREGGLKGCLFAGNVTGAD